MKKLIVAILALFSISAFSQSLPWPQDLPCAQVPGLDPDNRFTQPISAYAFLGNTFKEIEEMIAELQGKPKVKISFEYIQMRFGYQVLGQAEYFDCKNYPEDDDEKKMLRKKSAEGTLTAADFKGPRWLHIVQPIDTEEANCLALSKVNGKLGGCNDLWQDGVSEDEVVCIKDRTYLKCHIDCVEKIYNRNIDKVAGFCPAQE